ncbi:MAG: acyltransferase family protein [Defluviitaleaceae bacterium]|nr:acyltransferase family protein [Defluviitaleaceae bacterium]
MNRQLYIDNIRLLIIVLVVLQHLAVTYSGFGGWYYIEPGEIGIVQTIVFGFHQAFTQGWFMGLLFLISGYFTPASYDKKGFGKFAKDRFIRLGLPAIIYMLVIHPILAIGILGHRLGEADGFLATYAEYLIGLHFIGGSGPLWFAVALLIFSLIYALLRICVARKILTGDKNFPGFMRILGLILLISVCAFLVRIVQPIGTDIFNMQLGYFSQYVILFIVGIYCKRCDWLEKLEYNAGRRWLICGISLGFVLFVVIMILGGALDGDLTPFDGGVTWQSAAYALWESFVAVAMAIGLIALFKEKFNTQSAFVKRLSANAFSVFVFHSIIIVPLTLLFSPVDLIPIVKFFIAAVVGIPLCFLITDLTVQRIPFLRRLFA